LVFKFKICGEITVLGKPSFTEEQAELAIGIILSAKGSEGAAGIQSIKGKLGMVMLQDSAGAK
jgi:chemotaxis response regulator CheB